MKHTQENRPSNEMEAPVEKFKFRFNAECLKCGHTETIYHNSNEDYQPVSACPKCIGTLVDTFKLLKYQREHATKMNNRKSEAIFYMKYLFGVKKIVFIMPANSLHKAIEGFDKIRDIEKYENLYVQFKGQECKLR